MPPETKREHLWPKTRSASRLGVGDDRPQLLSEVGCELRRRLLQGKKESRDPLGVGDPVCFASLQSDTVAR
jgi:hypothetical protein